MKVATLERFLDRQGKLTAFKAAFEAINGRAVGDRTGSFRVSGRTTWLPR